jgi:hypothetical protein
MYNHAADSRNNANILPKQNYNNSMATNMGPQGQIIGNGENA